LHAYNETYTNENSGMVARHWRLYKDPEFLSASATPPPPSPPSRLERAGVTKTLLKDYDISHITSDGKSKRHAWLLNKKRRVREKSERGMERMGVHSVL
jgi:hypothetical protein